MRATVPACVMAAILVAAADGAAAQQAGGTLEALKALAQSHGGIAQVKSFAQAAYANAEREWAACKALSDVKARAACYEQVHDRYSAQVAAYLR